MSVIPGTHLGSLGATRPWMSSPTTCRLFLTASDPYLAAEVVEALRAGDHGRGLALAETLLGALAKDW